MFHRTSRTHLYWGAARRKRSFALPESAINLQLEAVQRLYWWPSMVKEIKQYAKACALCQRNKGSTQAAPGLLQPLPIPDQPFDSVSMDFISQLPTTKTGFDTILVVVCRSAKSSTLSLPRAKLVPLAWPSSTETMYRNYMEFPKKSSPRGEKSFAMGS